MTKTAVNDLRPCWRCDGITFWRARDGGPLRDLRAGARRLAHRRTPAGDPGAALAA